MLTSKSLENTITRSCVYYYSRERQSYTLTILLFPSSWAFIIFQRCIITYALRYNEQFFFSFLFRLKFNNKCVPEERSSEEFFFVVKKLYLYYNL